MTELGFWDKHPQPWTYYKVHATSHYVKYVVTDKRHAEIFETTDEQIATMLCNVVNSVNPAAQDANIQMFPITVAKQSVGLEPLHRPASGITQV